MSEQEAVVLRPDDIALMDEIQQASNTLNAAIRKAQRASLLVVAEVNGDTCNAEDMAGFQPCRELNVAVGQGTVINAH